jgi:hypothetical protein
MSKFGDSVTGVCHAWGCMVGCWIGRISHTNLKNRMVIYGMVISGIATSKNHIYQIELLLVPGQI